MGETGFLVPLEQMQTSPFEPVDPDKFSRDMAEKMNRLMADESLRKKVRQSRTQTSRRKVQLGNHRRRNKKNVRIAPHVRRSPFGVPFAVRDRKPGVRVETLAPHAERRTPNGELLNGER